MMNEKKNILILDSIFQFGGVEKYIFNIAEKMDKDKYNLVFCTLYAPGPMGDVIKAAGYTFYHDLIENKYDFSVLKQLKGLIKKHNIKLIYIINQPLTLFWGFLAAKTLKLPLVSLVANTFLIKDDYKQILYRLLFPYVDKIVAVAESHKHHIIKYENVAADKVVVIYNGVNLQDFDFVEGKTVNRSDFKIADDSTIIGVCGRLVSLKGVDVFLQAAKILIEKHPNLCFIIVGTGPESENLAKLINQLRIQNEVRLLGFREDLYQIMALFDIAVLASRSEALPTVVIEYMASKKPIVATDVGSVNELVTEGENGFLVEADKPDLLAEKIDCLIENKQMASHMSEKSWAKIDQKFKIETAAKRTEELFDEVLNISC